MRKEEKPVDSFATILLKFGEEGIGPGMFKDARSIAVDGSGRIYVGEYSGGPFRFLILRANSSLSGVSAIAKRSCADSPLIAKELSMSSKAARFIVIKATPELNSRTCRTETDGVSTMRRLAPMAT